MAYVPNSGSVVAFQSDPTKLLAHASVAGSVTTLQGTNPWIVQLTSGSVVANGNSSVQIVGQIPPQSVSGVGTFNVNPVGNGSVIATLTNSSVAVLQGTTPWAVGNSSVTVMNAIPPHSVSGVGTFNINPVGGGSVVAVLRDSSVATLQGTNPWMVQLTSGSVITTGGNSSVQVVGLMPPQSVSGVGTFNINPVGSGSIIATLTNSSVAVLQGTTPWVVNITPSVIAYQLAGSIMAVDTTVTTGPSSVQLLGGSNSIGSVTALQGTNPWIVNITPSVIAYQLAGSIMAVNATVETGPSSVQLLGGSNSIGSVTALQGTNPWVVGNSSVTVMNAIPPHSVSGVGTFNINPVGSGSIIGTLINSSVATLQGTNPWMVQLTSGSVITTGGNSSVQVVGLMPPQSVSGVGTFNIDPVGAGSIFAKLINSSVTAYQGVTPWVVQTTGSVLNQYREDVAASSVVGVAMIFRHDDSSSMMGVVSPSEPLPIKGSVMALQGTNPWVIGNSSVQVNNIATGNSSVQLISTSASIATQVNRILTGVSSVELMSTSASIATQVNRILQGVSSVQILTGIGVIGSVAVLQSTNPWVVGNSSVLLLPGLNVIGSVAVLQAGTVPWPVVIPLNSIAGTYAEDATHTAGDRGIFTLGVRNDAVASFTSANLEYNAIGVDSAGRTLVKPFAPVESSIFSHASIVSPGTGSGAASVVLFAAAGAGLRNYITDFALSNTGATTTLLTFIDNGSSILGKYIVPAGGGSNMPGLNAPIANIAVNDRIGIILSSASSIVTVTAMGYKAP